MSHGRLVAFLHQHQGTAPLARVYSKTQLISLCEAYDLRVSPRLSKSVLAESLSNAIGQYTYVPLISSVDDRILRVAESTELDGHIRIRISRGIGNNSTTEDVPNRC